MGEGSAGNARKVRLDATWKRRIQARPYLRTELGGGALKGVQKQKGSGIQTL